MAHGQLHTEQLAQEHISGDRASNQREEDILNLYRLMPLRRAHTIYNGESSRSHFLNSLIEVINPRENDVHSQAAYGAARAGILIQIRAITRNNGHDRW